jgi:glycosyltransferase involved in cell wall biosynthesis
MQRKRVGVARVAMLAHTCYLRDPRVRREAEALAEKGIEVHVIALSEDGRGPGAREPGYGVLNGVQIHRLPVRRRRGGPLRYLYEYFMVALCGGLKLTLLHARRRLDVVHVHNMPDLLVFAAIIPRLTGSTVILDIHDPMPELFLSWNRGRVSNVVAGLLRLQAKISCAFADRVVSVNETMRENLRDHGIAEDKIFIVHNFPDQKLFPLRESPPSWPRNRESLVMLYSGTVTEHYDLGLAVKAIARLVGEIPVTLRIVGEGNRLKEVLDLASELGVRDSVIPVGTVPLERVTDEMQKADLGISCHRAGIFGDLYFSTKIVEYLTQGLPVVSPLTYTVAKYLSADCLFYFEPGSDEALAETLRFMWRNPAEVVKRLTTARQSVPRLSWQAEKTEFQSFYGDLLSDRNPPARVAVGR